MIKSHRLAEVKELMTSPEFQAWWTGLSAARNQLGDATDRYDELLAQAMLTDFRAELAQKNAIDTLYQSGEFEDVASGLLADSTELENQSFKALGDFEELRYKVSEMWYRLGASERQLDDLRDQVKELLAGREKATPANRRDVEGKLATREQELKTAERTYRALHADYERENSKKTRLWDEVERIWARSAEMNLTMAEKRVRSKKVRREAEALFAQAEDRKRKAAQLRQEAEVANQAKEVASQAAGAQFKAAREKFGCAPGDDFLYFRERDQNQRALAVGLVSDSQSYNIEVKPLAVYTVDRQRGVGFLEPAIDHPSSQEEGDRRFEDFFLKGRKGTIKAPSQPAVS